MKAELDEPGISKILTLATGVAISPAPIIAVTLMVHPRTVDEGSPRSTWVA
jgi:hypothetical protein